MGQSPPRGKGSVRFYSPTQKEAFKKIRPRGVSSEWSRQQEEGEVSAVPVALPHRSDAPAAPAAPGWR